MIAELVTTRQVLVLLSDLAEAQRQAAVFVGTPLYAVARADADRLEAQLLALLERSAPRVCDRCGESAVDGLVAVVARRQLLTVHRIYCELPGDEPAPGC